MEGRVARAALSTCFVTSYFALTEGHARKAPSMHGPSKGSCAGLSRPSSRTRTSSYTHNTRTRSSTCTHARPQLVLPRRTRMHDRRTPTCRVLPRSKGAHASRTPRARATHGGDPRRLCHAPQHCAATCAAACATSSAAPDPSCPVVAGASRQAQLTNAITVWCAPLARDNARPPAPREAWKRCTQCILSAMRPCRSGRA